MNPRTIRTYPVFDYETKDWIYEGSMSRQKQLQGLFHSGTTP